MKKIIAIAFAIITCFALVACKSDIEVSHSGYKKCSHISFSETTEKASIKVLRVAKYESGDGTVYCGFNAYSSDKSSVFDRENISASAKNFPSSVTELYSGKSYKYVGVLGYIISERLIVEYSERKKRAILTYDKYLNIDISTEDLAKIKEREIYGVVCEYGSGGDILSAHLMSNTKCETERREVFCDVSNSPYIMYEFEKTEEK